MTTAAAQQKPTPLPQPIRSRLPNVVKGKLVEPMRISFYGPEGVGKSSFAAGAPKPIFLCAEDGTAQLDIERYPMGETWEDVRFAVRDLTESEHEYQTLVVDTLDWVEPLLWAFICKRDAQANVEAYGYGKGYQVALDEWRKLLADLDALRKKRRMHIVLLAHSWIRPFKNPSGEDFDRYEMKFNAKASGLIKEWSDAVLFANWETFAKKDDRTKRVKGVSTGARLIYTERTAAWDAKNRFSLPEEIPLSWSDFEQAAKAGEVASPAALREEIARKAKELGPDLERVIAETVAKAGDNAQSLALINNKVNARLAAKEQQQ